MLSHPGFLSPDPRQKKAATPQLCDYFNIYICTETTREAESNTRTEKPLARANPEKKHLTVLGASLFPGLSGAAQTRSVTLETHRSTVQTRRWPGRGLFANLLSSAGGFQVRYCSKS